jgi:hypothetical protein
MQKVVVKLAKSLSVQLSVVAIDPRTLVGVKRKTNSTMD